MLIPRNITDPKEIGAGIGLGPNAAKVLHLIGLDKECAEITSTQRGPHSHIWMRIRKWDTGWDTRSQLLMGRWFSN